MEGFKFSISILYTIIELSDRDKKPEAFIKYYCNHKKSNSEEKPWGIVFQTIPLIKRSLSCYGISCTIRNTKKLMIPSAICTVEEIYALIIFYV